MKKLMQSVLILGMACASSSAFAGDGDPAKGERLWSRCKACHSLEDGQNRVGPHLSGLFDRKAGAVEGYKYSPAMAGSDVIWTDESLSAYLKDPKGYIPKNKMAFAGLKKQDHIDHLIAYLRQELGQ